MEQGGERPAAAGNVEPTTSLPPPFTRDARAAAPPRAPEYTRCDACGEGMQPMGHCKWLCRSCGFLRTCIDTV